MNSRFANKVALVAGGTGGLGRAVSRALLDEGATVVSTYRNPIELESLKKEAGPQGSALLGESVDVTDEGAVRSMVERVAGRHGGIDVLVNAVGGYAGGIPVWETDLQVLERMLALNLRSGHTLARGVAPGMIERKRGSIVNVAAKAAFDHGGGAGAYAASKAAALALMDCLAEDLKGTGVRVNTILPSIIDTEVNRKAMARADFSKWPKPEAIARVVLFLCSDEAEVVHGAAVPVYGNG